MREPTGRGAKRDKGKPLQKMFEQVPEKYDFLNRLLTFRLDELWRKKAVKKIMPADPEEILDLGTGTGDLAIRMAKNIREARVTGYDFSPSMLNAARNKAHRLHVKNIDFVEGDAAEMPFEDNRFDVIGISFAFRNITFKNPHTTAYLKEIYRTLKPEGKFVIVESSQPRNRLIRYLFHLYLMYIVSFIGGKISGAKGAYDYLAHSARNFYYREELTNLLKSYGFDAIAHEALLFGAAAITTARKPSKESEKNQP